MSQLLTYQVAKLADAEGFKAMSNGYDSPFYVIQDLVAKSPWGTKTKYKEGQLETDTTDETCCDNHDVQHQYRLYVGTQSELQKWIRENYKLHVSPELCYKNDLIGWYVTIEKIEEIKLIYESGISFDTYEEALEHGLEKSFDKELNAIKDGN